MSLNRQSDEDFCDLLLSLTNLDDLFAAPAPPPFTYAVEAAPTSTSGWGRTVTTSVAGAQPVSHLQAMVRQQSASSMQPLSMVPPARGLRTSKSEGVGVEASDGATVPMFPSSKGAGAPKRQRPSQAVTGPAVKETISSLEAQVSAKMAHLALLTTQNQALRRRASMLETVIQARDDQVVRLKRLKQQLTAREASFQGTGRPPTQSDLVSMVLHGTFSTDTLAQQGSESFEAEAGWDEGDSVPPVDAKLMLHYQDASIEQLMEVYKGIVAALSAEITLPDWGRLLKMMAHLREFTRSMALVGSKQQLLQTRDVSAGTPATSGTADTAIQRVPLQHSQLHSPVVQHQELEATACTGNEAMAPPPAITQPPQRPDQPQRGPLPAQLSGCGSQCTPSGLSAGALAPTSAPTPIMPQCAKPLSSSCNGGDSTDSDGSSSAGLVFSGGELHAHWLRVARQVNLTPGQLADMVVLADLHAAWLGEVHAQREKLTHTMNALLATNRYSATYRDISGSMTERQVTDLLHNNVQREQALMILVGEVATYRILTLAQYAQVLVHSYPLIPDAIGFMTAYAEIGRQSALAGAS